MTTNLISPEGAAVKEDFAQLLAEAYSDNEGVEGTVVTGKVVAIENDMALIDVGLKSEGRIPLREFSERGKSAEIKTGDTVEVFLERMENANGEVVLSREKALREESWVELERSFKDNARVSGVIFGRVKGGFTVDLSGAVAFLPGSQVDVRPVRELGHLMGSEQWFQILKMDRRRGNIVVSRRAVLEETRAEAKQELVANLSEGQVLEGVVKNVTDYGAFVDLGGVDGLLHVTDMAWRRVNHPTEVVSVGDTVKVQVIRLNAETQRISLGIKQFQADPWEGIDSKYPVEAKFKGRVTNVTDYGAFVELEPGVEGLVHVSEMSWTKKNVHPGKIVATSQEIEVMVLDVDPNRRRVSLGVKQCTDNPWQAFGQSHKAGIVIKGEVKSITEFGLFIGLDGGVDGMVHLSDLSWDRPGEQAIEDYEKGAMVEAKVLDVDIDKERISLGIKQLSEDPNANTVIAKKGDTVTCTVTGIKTDGIDVSLDGNIQAFIRKSNLARARAEQRPDRFAVGDKVDARVTSVDAAEQQIGLSVKALEISDEREAMAQFGSSESGASLGDILGAAIKAKDVIEEDDEGLAVKTTAKKVPATDTAKDEVDAETKPAADKPAKKSLTKKKAPAKKVAPKKNTASDTPAAEATGQTDE